MYKDQVKRDEASLERDATALKLEADRYTADVTREQQRFELDQARFDLEEDYRADQLRIQEEIARIDQDIERDRIQHNQEIAQGNWQNALNIQDRIDERERAGRQLDRELFNANQANVERKFELERAEFDLDKLEFFQSLSLAPANFADIFNITRGLAPTGAGGPLPQGIQRIGSPSDVQQTAAQDYRQSGINLGVNVPAGGLPRLEAEPTVKQFDTTQPGLSFLEGGDPTPVGPDGLPLPPAYAHEMPEGSEGAGVLGGIDLDTVETGIQPSAVTPELDSLMSQPATIQSPRQPSPQELMPPVSQPTAGGLQPPQGAPLPIGLQLAFNNQQLGAPQTPQQSIPLLSPQRLAQLSPAEREAYFALAQMQGQYLPDFQSLLAARGSPQSIADSQRVFV
jgi:hypothetical protein